HDADGKDGIIRTDSQILETETLNSEPKPEESSNVGEITASISDNKHQIALDDINNSNAEESEDEALKEVADVPMKDYHTLSLDELVDELKKLIHADEIMSVK